MNPRLLAALLGLWLVVAGCSSDSEDPSSDDEKSAATPAEETVDGVYEFSGKVLRTTFKNHKKAVPSNTLELTCLDEECDSVLQRANAVGNLWWTVLLRRTEDGWVGTHQQRGSCPEGQGEGKFTDTLTWSWTRVDGSLQGEARDVFRGCDLDGGATTRLTLQPVDQPRAALTDAALGPYVEALAAYDKSLRQVNAEYADCADSADGECWDEVLGRWASALGALAEASEAAADSAEGACAEALEAARLGPVAKALREGARGYERVEADASDVSGDAIERAWDEHSKLVTIVRWCVPAQQIATMKKAPEFDTYEAIPPAEPTA